MYFLASGSVTLFKTVYLEDRELKTKVKKSVPISNLQAGRTLIGDEIVFSHSDEYKYTAIVVSDFARIYKVKKSDLIQCYPKETKAQLMKEYNAKEEQRESYLLFLKGLEFNDRVPCEIMIREGEYLTNQEIIPIMAKNLFKHFQKKVDVQSLHEKELKK